nr:hypothetical protein [Brevundimonas sp.]
MKDVDVAADQFGDAEVRKFLAQIRLGGLQQVLNRRIQIGDVQVLVRDHHIGSQGFDSFFKHQRRRSFSLAQHCVPVFARLIPCLDIIHSLPRRMDMLSPRSI